MTNTLLHQAAYRMPVPARPSLWNVKEYFTLLTPFSSSEEQALLQRHEAYMADAERNRLDLTARIERLEMEKHELEAENAAKIKENRDLLDQLEALNTTVAESDTTIKALEASLLSSQQSVRRLESAADRAAEAERHLVILENEQEHLHELLQSTREDARSHSQRCKEAQRGILDMQDQLERIEEEARQERERHADVVSRMERQREVEKQLDLAASRLKGAAVTKTIQKNGNGIVGHFVRDLLQDNANLQLGIAELRELLLNANDEVEALREQLTTHQPLPEEDTPRATTLQRELETVPESPKVNQQLHIHHHYHVTSKQDARKPKKKRLGAAASGIFTPPNYSSSPTTSQTGPWRLTSSPTAPALLTTACMEPSTRSTSRHSWSGMSDQPSDFASSVPSSPRSNQRNSVFDHEELELPTSPTTSFDPMSPAWHASHRKESSEISSLSFQSLQPDSIESPVTPLAPRHHRRYYDDTIEEEDEDASTISRLETPDLINAGGSVEEEGSTVEGSEISRDDFFSRPRIHRVVSHESIMSLTGGLDIHTLKARPSQMTLRPLGGAEAVVTVTGVTAQPTLSRGSTKRSAVALRDSFAGLPQSRAVSNPTHRATRSPSPNIPTPQASSGSKLGKLVGWMPWGGSSPNSAQATPTSTPTPTPKASEKETQDKELDYGRAPGINQPGAIPGFQKYWAGQKRRGAPAKVTAATVDHESLASGLQD